MIRNNRILESSPKFVFLSPCFFCLHKYKNKDGCSAFPKGKIPSDILLGKFDHKEIHPLQTNDVIFEQEEKIVER